MKAEKTKFKRTHYYILPRFQNHFMLVAFFQVLLFAGGMILPQYRILSSYIEKKATHANESAPLRDANSLGSQAPNKDEQELQELILMRNSMTLYSSIFVIATSLIFGFYFSHRFAGPIYKTILYLRNYQQGKQPGKLSFRTGDFFHELAEEVNNSLQEKNKSVPD